MSFHLSNSLVLDGYRLIRFLGRGGFGEVWLCRSEAMGDYRALKFISTHDSDRLEKEYQALIHYRKAVGMLRSPRLVPIEHVNRNEAGLYYVMPLADGSGADDPADSAWAPVSLTAMIHDRAAMPAWFSSGEITALMQPVLEALQTLSDAGLVHRDVKPENILFFHGQPCLGDISLLGADASVITRRGTPGYTTPSWYVGGHPDMYGVAATLFSLLTGNSPDRMGRAAFIWPPQGEASLSESERAAWKRLHAVIRRGTDENVSERFVDFMTMASALAPEVALPQPPPPPSAPAKASAKSRPIKRALVGIAVLIVIVWLYGLFLKLPSGGGLVQAPPDAVPHPEISSLRPPGGTAEPSPLIPNSSVFGDANLAYNCITALNSPGTVFESAENDIHMNVIGGMASCVLEPESLNIPMALRYVEEFFTAIPRLKDDPKALLAWLLLRQCNGEDVSSELEDPTFVKWTGDDLRWRVSFLRALHANDKAEEFLNNVVSSGEIKPTDRCDALLQRADLNAARGSFSTAKADVDAAILGATGNHGLVASLKIELLAIEAAYPAYAAYLKSLPEK